MALPLPAVCLVGAPTDVGAGLRGAGMGPAALRVAGLAEAIRTQGRIVVDAGDLAGPSRPESSGLVQGLRHLPEVVAWNRAVFDAVAAALGRGACPLLMGGDHSLAIGSISAVAAHCRRQGRRLRVLWLDAHADANTAATSPSGNLHGMPVACLLGQGPAALTGWSGAPGALRGSDLALIGIRSVDAQEKLAIAHGGLQVFDMRHVGAQGMCATLTEALQGLDADTHLHLSFDLDVLDPRDAPGVSTPVAGGPPYREMQLCMERVADTGRLASLDVMELNPARDLRNRSAKLAVDLIRRLFGTSPGVQH